MSGQRCCQDCEGGRNAAGIQFMLYRENVGMERISKRQPNEIDGFRPWFATGRQNADGMACVCHKPRLVRQYAFHTTHNGWGGIMHQCDMHGKP